MRHGHTGELFRGVLHDGTRVVVKKVDLSSAEKEIDYTSELEAYGKASNSRLVPLLGHSLGNLGEHMPGRDLASAFQWGLVSLLDYPTRLKIAIGVAQALHYLHRQCSPTFVHGDVQASSVLIDDDLEVRLGSLTKVCTGCRHSRNLSRKVRKVDHQNLFFTSCFVLSKVFMSSLKLPRTSNTTWAYDVYCFGKVLLELIRGKLGAIATKDKETIDKSPDKIYVKAAKDYVQPLIMDPSILLNEERGWFPPTWFKFYESAGATVQWKMMVIAKNYLNSHPPRPPLMVHVLEALQKPREEDALLES